MTICFCGDSMSRIAAAAIACCITISVVAQSEPDSSRFDREHTEWIANALLSIQTVRVGMTRADLLKVFTTEGGISSPSWRTYVFRECPYIKVDVKFDSATRHEELATDKITEISRPYLAWSTMDSAPE